MISLATNESLKQGRKRCALAQFHELGLKEAEAFASRDFKLAESIRNVMAYELKLELSIKE